MGIATALKEFRKEHGMEQEDLAKLLGTTQQTISNWESGTMPRANALKRISQVLTTYQKSGASTAPHIELGAVLPGLTPAELISPMDSPTTAVTRAKVEWPRSKTRQADTNDGEYVSPNKNFSAEFRYKINELLGNSIEFEVDASVSFQSLRQRIDYLSPKICAEIKVVTQPRYAFLNAERGVYRLTTLREMLERNNKPRQHYLLILILMSGGGMLSLSSFMALAALHRVDVLMAASASEAACMLAKLEKGQFSDLQDHGYEDDFLSES